MTNDTLVPPQDICQSLDVSAPEFVVETAIAKVWRVTFKGAHAALKIYHCDTMSKEKPGFDFLRGLDGGGAVRVLAQMGPAVVLDWLDGPSLGDLSRAGRDEDARLHLVDVANAMHGRRMSTKGLSPLGDWCADLLTLQFAPECPSALAKDMRYCQALLWDLLATSTDIAPLHGDLHHDNIKLGANGWRAFDAKGLVGDRTFELANAFRNPTGADALQRDSSRFVACVDLWADRFNCDRTRLMRWAATKTALSIAWRSGPILHTDDEADLLSMMLAHLPET